MVKVSHVINSMGDSVVEQMQTCIDASKISDEKLDDAVNTCNPNAVRRFIEGLHDVILLVGFDKEAENEILAFINKCEQAMNCELIECEED
jgi:hypothetical protein